MNKSVKQLLFLTFLFSSFLLWENAYGACSWDGNTGTVAAPYDDTDMVDCISDAASKTGDVVIVVPNCNVTWDSIVEVNMTNWDNVTELTIQGNSKTETVITSGSWTVTTETDKKFRITNMTINGPVLGSYGAAVLIYGSTKPSLGGGFRVDNINFRSDSEPNGRAIFVDGDTFGLIDNVDSEWYGQFSIVYTRIANASWSANDTFGNADAVYLENSRIVNNRITQAMLMDHWDGARIVIRYNTISGYYFGGHDNLDGVRANRQWEFYNNEIYTSSSWGMPLFALRGGTGYVFNNQMISSVDNPFFAPTEGIALTNYRSWKKADTWCDNIAEKYCVVGSMKACTTDADCDGTVGSCQQEDGDLDGTGYPCRGQIGMGKNQTSRPALFWNNTVKIKETASVLVGAMVNDNCIADSGETICNPLAIASGNNRWMAENHIKENRDYCNGSTKPVSCNSVITDYTAYTCPHPLAELFGSCDESVAGTEGYNTTSDDTTAPAAPSGLSIS
mgnify:CR=1 FL=1